MSVRIIQADVLDGLARVATGSVQTVVTSPPYWGLRDYGVEGQIGLEKTLEEYIEKLVGVFREVGRSLREDGTLWLNMGDCYSGNNTGKFRPGSGRADGIVDPRGQRNRNGNRAVAGMKTKDMVGLPWMLAFALRADGWYLRSDVVWAKTNPIPESVRDRPTRSHEFLFLLTKRPRYFYDGFAIREPAVANHGSGNGYKRDARLSYGGRGSDEPYVPASATFRRTRSKREKPIPDQTRGTHRPDRKDTFPTDFRNKRDVWTINCKAYKGAHLATFPPALVEPCLLAGASQHGCCPACGAGWKRIIKKSGGTLGRSWHDHSNDAQAGMSQEGCAGLDSKTDAGGAGYRVECVGWEPDCGCDAGDPIPCTVMDPFAGSGTVGEVAVRLGYDSILIELKPEYIRLCEERTKAALPP